MDNQSSLGFANLFWGLSIGAGIKKLYTSRGTLQGTLQSDLRDNNEG